MPAKDRYHETVKHALIKDGWTIVDEQVKLEIGRRRLWIDIHAEKAERNLAILVEVKGFENSPSAIEELAQALGQYIIYQVTLSVKAMRFPLFLAIPDAAYRGIFAEPVGRGVIRRIEMKLLAFDPIREEIVSWIP